MDLCRICSKQSTLGMIEIFDDNKSNVIEKLKIFKDIKIEKSDQKLSNQICHTCYTALNIAYDFYKSYHNSSNFHKILTHQSETELNAITYPNQKKHFKILPNSNYITWQCKNKNCLDDEVFTSAEDFINHMENVHLAEEIEKIQCFMCAYDNDETASADPLKGYKTKHELEMHIKIHHINQNLCTFCNTWFCTNFDIDNHLKNEHSNHQFLCKICNWTLKTRSEFNKHLKLKHSINNGLKLYCSLCNKLEFESIMHLAVHIKDVHQQQINKNNNNTRKNDQTLQNLLLDDNEIFMDEEFLDEWNEEFLEDIFFEKNDTFKFTESLLDFFGDNDDSQNYKLIDINTTTTSTMMTTTTNNVQKNIKIPIIDEKQSDKINKRQKTEFKLLELYNCPKCDKKFDKLSELKFHLAHEHDEYCLICNFCNHKFNRWELLNTHLSQHISENMTIYSKTISQFEIIQDNKNNNVKLIKCKQCSKVFRRERNFLIHICAPSSSSTTLPSSSSIFKSKIIENNSEMNNFLQCTLCKMNFKTQKDAYKHKKNVHDINPIECMICDKQFKTQIGLEYHLKVHTGIKAFNCPYCMKTFTANINLNAHLRNIHSKIKNFNCKLCNKKFSTSDHYKKHLASIHQNKRNHICTICDKSFTQKSHLTQHHLIHTGKKLYFCDCLKGYIKKSEMQKHLKKCNQANK